MEHNVAVPAQEPLSPKMTEWLKLRRALEDRITHPDLRALFHDFMMVDQELFEEEVQAAYERGLSAREHS